MSIFTKKRKCDICGEVDFRENIASYSMVLRFEEFDSPVRMTISAHENCVNKLSRVSGTSRQYKADKIRGTFYKKYKL